MLPPTELYNEGWLLRLVLDWFERQRAHEHVLSFLPGARWYSEALLAPAFLAEKRGDPRAEAYTHADGIIGHFAVHPGERSEATLLPDARQLVIVEAKLGSTLSPGVRNAPGYDQAARTVACMANMLFQKDVRPESLERLGFYIVAPRRQIAAGVFGGRVSKDSIRAQVVRRVAQYRGERDTWLREAFEPTLGCIELGVLPWESLIEYIQSEEPQSGLLAFYERCIAYNLGPSHLK